MTETADVTSGTLEVPGAQLHYEVRGSGPLLVLAGAPMNAAAFAPLADACAAEHTVLTTDPRGHAGSVLTDPEQDSTPELRGSDLARLIEAVDAGPAVVFGSSGGAVSALALASAYPDLVTTAIAHEPPLRQLLDDPAPHAAATEEMIETYRCGDVVGAWRQFMAAANIEIPDPVLQEMFGGERPAPDVASERYWFDHELRGTTGWEPDLHRLAAGPTRIVVGIGADSAGQFCDRTSRALAAGLGTEPVLFPGDHIGFVADPAGFAARLREVLPG